MRGRLIGLGVLGLAQSLSLIWGSHSDNNRQLQAILISAALGAVALGWIARDKSFKHAPLYFVFGLALTLRLICLQAAPLLEDDYFRYLWDGLQTATRLNPYQYAPEHFFGQADIPAVWQDILSGINHPDVPSIYGPALQAFFALGYWIAPAKLIAIQAQLLVLDMLTLWLLARYQRDARWLLVYAMHPLVLKEAMASAHPDILVGLFVTLSLIAWQRHRAALTGVWLGLGVATKVPALIALALLVLKPHSAIKANRALNLRWGIVTLSVFIGTFSLVYLPLLLGGGNEGSALVTFGTKWRFNPLLFRALEAFLAPQTARVFAAILIGAGVSLLAWQWLSEKRSIWPPIGLAMTLLLLLSPTVNPWYWLWALAPCVLMGQTSFVVAGCIGMLSYWNSGIVQISSPWMSTGVADPISVPIISTLLQVAVISTAWIWDYWTSFTRNSCPKKY